MAAFRTVEKSIKANGLTIAGWRDVPVDESVLGTLSAAFVPVIRQVVMIADGSMDNEKDFDKHLYDVRREIMGYFRLQGNVNAYVCSLSSKTIVYKGMLRSCDLSLFYKDLKDPRFKTTFAVYHRRFSTNTVPKWFLAQPMRLLAHNGEINTLLGNINWVKSRESNEDWYLYGKDDKKQVRGPLVDVGRSDSANLDR
jgi:glutamate synthase (ferredoxin)